MARVGSGGAAEWVRCRLDGGDYEGNNSLLNTILNFVSLFDTEKLFLPYVTTSLNFMPFITLLSILSLNVN